MHAAFSLLTLAPGEVGGSETYARALLDAFAAGEGPERVTVLAGEEAARTLAGGRGPERVAGGAEAARTLAGDRGPERVAEPAGGAEAARGLGSRGPVEVVAVAYAPGRGTVRRAAGLARGLVAPPRAARAAAARADVVHFPLTVPIPRGPAPAVVTLHDVLHLDLPDAVPAAERLYRRLAYDRAARRAAHVIAPSEHARGRIAARLGIAPERISAIPHGIDHARFRPAGDDGALAALTLPSAPFVLYPANLWPHKNHRRLLEALARGPAGLELVLTGAVYGRLAALLDDARGLGVADRVHHLGYVPPAALAPLYRRARALVFPSLYEGFGAPPLEAMACGCPVAASDAGAVAEACAGAALAFDALHVDAIAAALERIVSDEGLRERLRAAGLERAAALTWERSARAHTAAYASAMSTASRP